MGRDDVIEYTDREIDDRNRDPRRPLRYTAAPPRPIAFEQEPYAKHCPVCGAWPFVLCTGEYHKERQ